MAGIGIRHSLRALRKRPAFTVGTILTLALVIGASTAIFSALYGLVFRRLPYADPGRLVMIWDSNRKTGDEHLPMMDSAFPIVERQARSFDGIGAYTPPSDTSSMRAYKLWATEERVSLASCDSRLFPVLGTAPMLGRPFVAADAVPGGARVAILDHDFWRQHYGASPDAVGKTLSLNVFGEREDYTIVGVMPQGFEFPFPLVPRKPDVWYNLVQSEGRFSASHWLNVVARLRDGVSIRGAQSEIDTIAARIEAEHRREYEGERMTVVSLQSELIRDVRTILWVLLAAIACLFLIGCANIGNLLLVRAVGQERDMALRAALGAGRGALVRAAAVEITLLALAGGALGLLLAYWGMRTFLALLPPSLYIPRLSVVALDWRLLAIAAGLSIGATVLFGLLPGLRVLGHDLNPLLKPGSPSGGHRSSVFRRPGSILLMSEVCLALVLLTGTAMLTRSLRALLEANDRFQPERLLTVDVSFSNAAVRSLPDFGRLKVTLLRAFSERVAAMHGVRSVATAESFPLSTYPETFKLDVAAGPTASAMHQAELHVVTPNYFGTMAASLVRGRWFADSDTTDALPVAVINEAMARRYWPGRDPVGQRIGSMRFTDKWVSYQVVGVVKEPERFGKGDAAQPALYLSQLQVPLSFVSLIVRTSGDPRPLARPLRHAAEQISPGRMMVSDVRTGADIVSEASARLHFASLLLSALSAVAVLLAVIGIYGLLAYYTAQRTHEMGVRVALGATRGRIIGLVLGQGMLLTGAGVIAGIVAAAGFARSLTSLLYKVAPMDPATFAAAAIIVLVVAFLACYVPARRAAGVDPIVALRDE